MACIMCHLSATHQQCSLHTLILHRTRMYYELRWTGLHGTLPMGCICCCAGAVMASNCAQRQHMSADFFGLAFAPPSHVESTNACSCGDWWILTLLCRRLTMTTFGGGATTYTGFITPHTLQSLLFWTFYASASWQHGGSWCLVAGTGRSAW